MAYTQWGNLDSPNLLFCVHGLTRVGRDFDYLAQELVRDGYCVICPDVVGRGASDWLVNPANYNLLTYAEDMLSLIRELNLAQVDWLGTSLGGLIAMMSVNLALAKKINSPIRRLILNDVGPYIPPEAMQRIVGYLRKPLPIFSDLKAGETYLRSIYEDCGNLSDRQWQHLTKYSFKHRADGNYQLHYDPQIAYPYRNLAIETIKPQEFWELWQNIYCPILVLHGENSDVLLPDTIQEMQSTKSSITIRSFANVGHAPALMDEGQIEVVRNWMVHLPVNSLEC